MNKPNNKTQEISESFCGPISDLENMTLKDVDTLKKYMVDNNILRVFIDKDYCGYDGAYNAKHCQSRMETQLEADVRYAKELKQYEKEKEQQKVTKEKQIEKLKKEAKKLGLSVS